MRTVGYFFTGLFITVVLIAVAVGIEAAGYKWYLPWQRNQEYHLVRQTNEYVDSKQAQINGLLQEYNQLAVSIMQAESTPGAGNLVTGMEGQQKAKVDDMCDAASKIQDDQVPQAAKGLMRSQGCWEGNA